MRKLLLLPVTLPLGMIRGALEGAVKTTADALMDLASGDGDGDRDAEAPSTPPEPARTTPPSQSGGAPPAPVVDLDEARPAAAPSSRDVAEELGLEEGHIEVSDTLVESEGPADPGAEVTIDEPWPGYGAMRAADIVDRLRAADPALRAVVRLFEQQHRARRTVLAAAE
jgi:hypothetical protein